MLWDARELLNDRLAESCANAHWRSERSHLGRSADSWLFRSGVLSRTGFRQMSGMPLKVAFWAMIAVAAAAQGQEANSANLGSLAGQVIEVTTGAPVRKATLTLSRSDNPARRTTMAGPGGSFQFQQVPPGEYTLSATARGYLEPAQSSGSRVTIVLAGSQALSGILLRVTPQSVVSGHIVDEDGDPLAGAQIQLWRITYADGLRKLHSVNAQAANTDDRGWFRVAGLSPGRYYLSASPSRRPPSGRPDDDMRYGTSFYPGTPDPTMAAPVDLKPAEELDKVDMKLRKVHTVRVEGRVLSAVQAVVWLYPDNSLSDTGQTTPTAVSDGGFLFDEVFPGAYHLRVRVNQDGHQEWASLPISVASGGVDGITISPTAGASVKGTVTVETGGPAINFSKIFVRFQWVGHGAGSIYTTEIHEDGTFQTDALLPGKYRVSCNMLPPGFYLRTVRSGVGDAPGRIVDLNLGNSAPIEVLLSPKVASVSGTVFSPDAGKPSPRAVVVLVPQDEERTNDPSSYPILTADSSGNFNDGSLPPGEYKAFAWESIDSSTKVYMDPDFTRPFEAQGSVVNLTGGGHAEIKVRLIPGEAQ